MQFNRRYLPFLMASKETEGMGGEAGNAADVSIPPIACEPIISLAHEAACAQRAGLLWSGKTVLAEWLRTLPSHKEVLGSNLTTGKLTHSLRVYVSTQAVDRGRAHRIKDDGPQKPLTRPELV
ncbi:hypothetical protein EVAR_36258_1 [Eumeta japonica]|uniref:Uncharacterized protein n=1 Tax=Eumeta variegata TaxID=151549 RepID=A0A4C1WZR9_EUMVA|nr:hypothetical protein EVAR_36258_1 [Eumeta japonica]